MDNLVGQKCVACRGTEPTVTDAEIDLFHPQVAEWQIVERDNIKRLERAFKFKNFVEAVAFTNRVADIAETEGHHPMITTEWGKVTITW
jgi:4a-hydroxytetrahydrobiopterin dehydratase